ncbi:hypothetical protein CLU96_3458 [Chryseobacterium sp. 52]|uniref:hypothetical protein n=1 Tax=Chryseobacterium sp. 52 TaxID=2035213 RepID=UPI000C18FD34|nr:hypothetical protein [Chryseobacterium sp. 52]PIF46427.1 hypothetical protein CLU96_3458 [Chryseobacterium sp. 52]
MDLNIKKHALIFSVVSVLCLSCNKKEGKQISSEADSITKNDSTAGQVKDSVMSKPDTAANDQQALRIGGMLKAVLDKNDLKVMTDNDRKFSYAEADLNGDNNKEILVAMKGSYFCGSGGCTVLLLNSKGEKINTFTVVGGPVSIATDKTEGWADLVIPSKGKNYLVKYNGKKYPGNPSVQPEFSGKVPSSFQVVLGDSDAVYHF